MKNNHPIIVNDKFICRLLFAVFSAAVLGSRENGVKIKSKIF